MADEPSFTVFYAWQSDRKQSHHRYFILEALHEAAERLNADPDVCVEVEIDHDTKGVAGLCDIPATILGKIEKCDAFVADLTFVGRADPGEDGDAQSCSNPNVLFELGFAFHAIGWERLILVMNDAHGPATDQIFDLDHRRHPIRYTLPKVETTRNQVKAQLTRDLEGAIRVTIANGPRIPVLSKEDQFRKIASQMPELIDEMRVDLTDSDTCILREFFILKSTWSFSFRGQYLCYHLDKHDKLDAKILLLENNGYVEDVTEFGKNTKHYRFTEEFVDLVTHVMLDLANDG